MTATNTAHLNALLLECWDRAETKNVRGILQAVASSPVAFEYREQLCRAVVKALDMNGHLALQDAGNMYRALCMNADTSLTQESLEGLM